MKKFTVALFLVLGLVSTLSAHHMAEYEDAGVNIPEFSPHLLMEF